MMSTEEKNPDPKPDPQSTEDSTPPVPPAAEQPEETAQSQEIVKEELPQKQVGADSNANTSEVQKEDAQPDKQESVAVTSPVLVTPAASNKHHHDSDSIPDDVDTHIVSENTQRDWSNEKSARSIAIELKHIETEVRNLLINRDTKRKRKMAGSRRWQELEEDLLSWRFSNRMDENTIQLLQRLIARRNFLFTRLRFLASTRPTWNS